jgi:hypothetical protein
MAAAVLAYVHSVHPFDRTAACRLPGTRHVCRESTLARVQAGYRLVHLAYTPIRMQPRVITLSLRLGDCIR